MYIFLIGLQHDPVTLFIGMSADQIHKILTAADADGVAVLIENLQS